MPEVVKRQPMRRRGEIEMATEGDVELELETETSGPERPPEKPRKHDSGAADLERVTDYAEEKEIQSSNLETVKLAGSLYEGLREGRERGETDRFAAHWGSGKADSNGGIWQ